MDRSCIIYLIAKHSVQDDKGVRRDIETKRRVFANIKSVSSSEYFKAGEAGLKAAYVFTMASVEYDNESVIEYNNKRYAVYRTYIKGNGNIDTIEVYTNTEVGV